jgi:hypothetical protein
MEADRHPAVAETVAFLARLPSPFWPAALLLSARRRSAWFSGTSSDSLHASDNLASDFTVTRDAANPCGGGSRLATENESEGKMPRLFWRVRLAPTVTGLAVGKVDTRPLYRDLFTLGGAAGKEFALATFKKHQSMYHSICSKMVARDLGL